MLERVGKAITFYAQFTNSNAGAAGLAVTVRICKRDGTVVKSAASATAAIELDATNLPGIYYYTLASGSVDAATDYVAIFHTTGTADLKDVPALWIVGPTWVENCDASVAAVKAKTDLIPASPAAVGNIPTAAAIADAVWDEAIAGHAGAGSTGEALSAAGGAADPLLNPVPGSYASGTAGAALGRIGSSQITITSPVTQDGTKVTLISGDDYLNANGRALVFTRASGSAEWPDLTGATVRLKTPAFAAIDGTVVVATGAGQQVRFDVVRTLTTSLADIFGYEIEATLATSGNVVTLLRGTLVIVQDV